MYEMQNVRSGVKKLCAGLELGISSRGQLNEVDVDNAGAVGEAAMDPPETCGNTTTSSILDTACLPAPA
jgi:hypothetical protein